MRGEKFQVRQKQCQVREVSVPLSFRRAWKSEPAMVVLGGLLLG